MKFLLCEQGKQKLGSMKPRSWSTWVKAEHNEITDTVKYNVYMFHVRVQVDDTLVLNRTLKHIT